MNKKLSKHIDTLLSEKVTISSPRKIELEGLADMIVSNEIKEIIFICTHNSRRSIFAEIWASLACEYFGIDIEIYSGGTEATAVYPSVISSLEESGFEIENNKKIFSKIFSNKVNPQKDFLAVMVCDRANETCPVVFGAKARFSLIYIDPKEYDGTKDEKMKYEEKSHEIAREMFYLFSELKKINY